MTITRYLFSILITVLITVLIVLTVLTFTPSVAHPADACHEDENWIATDYRDPEGQEWRNVTRKCANVDDEPWIPTDNS